MSRYITIPDGRIPVARAVCWIVVIGVGVVCIAPAWMALVPISADSDTVTREFELRSETFEIDVPVSETSLIIHRGAYCFMPRFVMDDEPAVIAIAEEIEECSYGTDYSKAVLANEFVHRNIVYMSDEASHGESDYWQLPTETLRLGSGDCEDQAILLVSILKALGVDSVFVFEPGHVSAAVAVPGSGCSVEHRGQIYYTLDPVEGSNVGAHDADVEGTQGDSPDSSMWVFVLLFGLAFAYVAGAFRWLGVLR